MAAVSQVGGAPGEKISNDGYYRSLVSAASGDKAPPLRLEASNRALARAEESIAGAAQTYSKSWRQHIRGVSPVYLERGAGARAWDVDGNEYVDLLQGLLPNILGYAHADVDRAVYEQARRGHSFSLRRIQSKLNWPSKLKEIIPCAELVRYGKNGSARGFGSELCDARAPLQNVSVWQSAAIMGGRTGSSVRHLDSPASRSPSGSRSHTFPYNDSNT